MNTNNTGMSMRDILGGATEAVATEAPRRRGRPRKYPEATVEQVDPNAPKKRGRPRKSVGTQGEGIQGVAREQVDAQVEAVVNEFLEVGPEDTVTPATLPDVTPETSSPIIDLPDPLAALLEPEAQSLIEDVTIGSLTTPASEVVVNLNTSTVRVEIAGKLVKIESGAGDLADKTRYVSLSSFVSALQENMEVKNSCRIFPTGLRVLVESPKGLIVGFEAPERLGQVVYRTSEDKLIKFKNTVIPSGMTFIDFKRVGENEYSIVNFYQVATKGTVFNGDDMLYIWPGTNVWSDSRVCIGDIKRSGYSSIENLGSLQYLFYNGVNNDDLCSGKYKIDKLLKIYPEASKSKYCTASNMEAAHPSILWDFFNVKEGEKPKPFPYEILKNRLTLKDFLMTMFKCRVG